MQMGNTARQNPRSVPKKKEKLKVLIVKRTFLRMISPALSAPGLVQNGYRSDVSLKDGCQVVQKMGTRRSGHIQWSG